jgi:hypothetical protein
MLRSVLFWNITRRRVLIVYRRFERTYQSHLQGSRVFWRWDGYVVPKRRYTITTRRRVISQKSTDLTIATFVPPWRKHFNGAEFGLAHIHEEPFPLPQCYRIGNIPNCYNSDQTNDLSRDAIQSTQGKLRQSFPMHHGPLKPHVDATEEVEICSSWTDAHASAPISTET